MIFQDLLTGFVNINFLVDFTVKLCLWFVSAVVFILHPELITTELEHSWAGFAFSSAPYTASKI